MNEITRTLRDSKTARWGALAVVSFTMLTGYYINYVISPLKPLLEEYMGWNSADFGIWNSDWQGYHLGEDRIVDDEEPVYAPGNGEVKFVDFVSGYGYVIIIEHMLPDGSYVCSEIGHCQQEGLIGLGPVTKGQLTGYLSRDPQENGGYNFIHIHYGVRLGHYTTDLLYYDLPEPASWSWNWQYLGYTRNANLVYGDTKTNYDFTHEDMVALWTDPSDFITAHSQDYKLTFDYPDFTSVDGLNLVGSAVQDASVLQLTSEVSLETGAAWFMEKQYIQDGFETMFTFWISRDGADGFAFVIQNTSDTVLGANGGGLGYGDIPNSLAVEFDTWQNWPRDPGFYDYDVNDNHIGVHTMGIEPNAPGPHAAYPDAIQGETTAIPFLSDAQIHTAKVTYVPGFLAIYLDDLIVPVLEVPIDIASVLALDNGTAWVGFTGATGVSTEFHDILSWSFAVAAPPEPDLTSRFLMVTPDILQAGNTATVNATIANGPDAPSGPCQATVNFGTQTATVDVPALPANGSFPFSVDFDLITQGSQLVEVIADSANAIAESDETNNLTSATVTVLPPPSPLPDLVASVSQFWTTRIRFFNISLVILIAEVQNVGQANAGPFTVTADIPELNRHQQWSYSALAQGSRYPMPVFFLTGYQGQITVQVQVDSANQVSEADETNNLAVVSEQI